MTDNEKYLALSLADQIDASAKAIRDLGGDDLAARVRGFAKEVRHTVAAGGDLFASESPGRADKPDHQNVRRAAGHTDGR